MVVVDPADDIALAHGKVNTQDDYYTSERELSQAAYNESLSQELIDRLINQGNADDLKLLKDVFFKTDNPTTATVDVAFKDLEYSIKSSSSEGADEKINTLGTGLFTLACGLCMKAGSMFRNSERKVSNSKPILHEMSGCFYAGRVTLLLGTPGSGKSSLFRVLSGQVKKSQLSGSVDYNGHNMWDVNLPSITKYVSQDDTHIPTLTTRETLDFAFKCGAQTSNAVNNDFSHPDRVDMFMKNKVNVILSLLGLTDVADTVVGDDALKGISGGEKRRVTLGEMLVHRARVYYLDSISTGLDSTSTFDIIKTVRVLATTFGVNIVVSLLQPPPEVYELFDDVLLLDQGYTIYHGPRLEIIPYFDSLGFKCPHRMDIADFLQELSTSDGVKYFGADRSTMPACPREFNERFKRSEQYLNMLADVERIQQEDKALPGREGKYEHSFWYLTAHVSKRQFKVMCRNKAFIITRIVQSLVYGSLMGGFAFQLGFDQWYIRAMVFMNIILYMGFASVALIPALLVSRNVFYKHNRENFYSALSFMFAESVVSVPFILIDAVLLGSVVYFLTGLTLTGSGWHFFLYLFILFSQGISGAALIRAIGFSSKTRNGAMAIAVLVLVLEIVFSGSVATFDLLPDIYYINPVAWVIISAMQNEFLSETYTASTANETLPATAPNINGKCALYCGGTICPKPYPDMNCGEYFLKSRQFPTDQWYMWFGVGYAWFALFFFVCVGTIVLKFIKHDNGKTATGDSSYAKRGMELSDEVSKQVSSFPKVTLAFRDLWYTVKVTKRGDDGKKESRNLDLLKGVSGFAKPHEMTALMGSSGAGKTTLMDVIADRKTVGTIRGTVYVNGKPKNPTTFPRLVSYVEQFALHNETSTVREALEFSTAMCTNPSRDRIDPILQLLELESLQNCIVGNRVEGGLSFEQIKRLTIGVGLVSNPSVLLCDEPTSGLESRAAMIVMKCLRNVAKTGRTVICTIHQPSVTIFGMFDNLLLMKKGGEVVYFAPPGKDGDQLIRYFEQFPGVLPCPDNLNPATWMLDVITHKGEQADEDDLEGKSLDFARLFKDSKENKLLLEIVDRQIGNIGPAAEVDMCTRSPESTISLLGHLLGRCLKSLWRTPGYSLSRLVIVGCFFPLLLGVLFFRKTVASAAEAQSRVGVTNMLLLLAGNYGMNSRMAFSFTERGLFYREKAGKMYPAWMFAVGSILAEIPHLCLVSIFSVNTFYFLVGFNLDPVTSYVFYWAAFLVFYFVMTTIGQMLSFVAPNAKVATLFCSLCSNVLSLAAGVSVPGSAMPQGLLWLYYFSPMRWALECVISTQFEFDYSPICYPYGPLTYPENGTCVSEGTTLYSVPQEHGFHIDICCPYGNTGSTAREYVLYGSENVPSLLGGEHGYSYGFRFYDLIYLGGIAITFVSISTLFSVYKTWERR